MELVNLLYWLLRIRETAIMNYGYSEVNSLVSRTSLKPSFTVHTKLHEILSSGSLKGPAQNKGTFTLGIYLR